MASEEQDGYEFDVLLKGGLVYSGKNSLPRYVDIGILGENIVFVGDADLIPFKTDIEYDVSGYIVSPGFIDIHTHSYEEIKKEEGPALQESYLTQGVTTVFTGNDGRGPWGVEEYFNGLMKRGIGTNIAVFVGHGAVRKKVMGLANKKAEPYEMEEMKSLVKQGMEQGALGLSTGLFYTPGSFSTTEEVVELAKVASTYGGIYESHIRDESSYSIGLLNSIKETLLIGQEANIPIHFAHIKALGVDVWGQSSAVIDLINQARKKGQLVTADQYPWLASGTGLSAALLPKWSRAGGNKALMKRLEDEATTQKIRREMIENLRRRGGDESILLVTAPDGNAGINLKEYRQRMKFSDSIDAALHIIQNGGAKIASFNMQEADLINFMQQPWVMSSSDGGNGHPRKFASFPQKFQQYVVTKKVLTVPEFIHRSSGMTADTFGIKNRGYIKVGYKADILVFKTTEYQSAATYKNPYKLSKGVELLFVNGVLAVSKGKITKTLNGQAIHYKFSVK